MDIYEFRSFELYQSTQILGYIRPIWERIFPIEIEYFFENFLSISFRIRIVSNRTTSISVEVYEYRRYLGDTGKPNTLQHDGVNYGRLINEHE